MSSVCPPKFGGGMGLPAAPCSREGLGVGRWARGWRQAPLPSAQRFPKRFGFAGCGHVRSSRRARRVGLRAAAGDPRTALAGGPGLGRMGMDDLGHEHRHQLD